MDTEDRMEDEVVAFKSMFGILGPKGASFGFLVDQQKTGVLDIEVPG